MLAGMEYRLDCWSRSERSIRSCTRLTVTYSFVSNSDNSPSSFSHVFPLCIWSSPKLAHTKIAAVRQTGQVPVTEEADVFEALGLAYRAPEQREQLAGAMFIPWRANYILSLLEFFWTLIFCIFFWHFQYFQWPQSQQGRTTGLESPNIRGWTIASCVLCRRASQVGHLWSDKRVRCSAARIWCVFFSPWFFHWHW